MSMKIENISGGKIIGIGEVSILPGETKEVPKAYESSPILEIYRRKGFAKIIKSSKVFEEKEAKEKTINNKTTTMDKSASDAEVLRKARLASLDGISEEDLGKLANELGINLAECKNQSDVLKKVKAALKK